MSILPPELDANYEVLEEMHAGGMGAVYKARHRHLDEPCVIKVMHARLKEVAGARERFFSEAKRGKQFRHRNIAEVLGFFVGTDGKAYLVMEYVEGQNLRDVLSVQGPLPPDAVVTIGVQTLAALACLHERQVIHRDISPDNLMLTKDPAGVPLVKLIDLGIAKSLDETLNLTGTGTFIGKVHYASPEQFRQRADARSDLYSLGVVLYELATGAKPSRETDTMAIIAAALREEPPRPFDETDPHGSVPPGLRAVILKAIAKNAECRYESADAFSRALERARESDRTTAIDTLPPTEPMTVPTPASKREAAVTPGRNRPRLAIAAAVLLVLVGYSAVRMLRVPNTEKPHAPVTASIVPTTTTVTVTAPEVVTPGRKQASADAVARGKQLAAARRFEEAYTVFTEATKADPDNAYAWANLGGAAAVMAKPGEARAAYERALRLEPSNWLAHYNFACLLTRSGARDDALQHLAVAIAQLRLQAKSREELDTVIRTIEKDDALGALRNDSRFIRLVRTE